MSTYQLNRNGLNGVDDEGDEAVEEDQPAHVLILQCGKNDERNTLGCGYSHVEANHRLSGLTRQDILV